MLLFKEFADARDLCLILVHHTRKNTESANPFDQISGTNGLLGAADGAFVLYREKGEVFLDFVGRDLPEQRYVLKFEPPHCLWEVVRTDVQTFEEQPEPLHHINPHAFRHTAASVLIAQGTDVATVSKMLGHTKVSATEDIYSHVIEDCKQRASNALTEVYFRRKTAEN